MKYEFKKIDDDTTELHYKDKVFKIERDVELLKSLQEIEIRARNKMFIELSKQGITKNDLVVIKKEGNKTYEDNSNLIEVESNYIAQETTKVYDEICQRYTNLTMEGLMYDIGLNIYEENEENEKFGIDLSLAIMGKTESPSKEEK